LQLISINAFCLGSRYFGRVELRLKDNQTGSVVLKAVSENVKYCYEQALRAETRAAQEQNDPMRQRFWLDSEARWLALAASYQYQARLSVFIKEMRGFIKSPLCSACDLPMRPKRIVQSGNGLFEIQYECANCEAMRTVWK
jgi:hypothetical protein